MLAPRPVALRVRVRAALRQRRAVRRDALVRAARDAVAPLHAAEVRAPHGAAGRDGARAEARQPRQRQRGGRAPRPARRRGRVVERPVDVHGRAQAREEDVCCRAADGVRLVQRQLPRRVERVDLQLVVVCAGAVWVEEELDVVVVEDDALGLGQRAPDVLVVHERAVVEVRVVVEELAGRVVVRRRPGREDVRVLHPWRAVPAVRVVQQAPVEPRRPRRLLNHVRAHAAERK